MERQILKRWTDPITVPSEIQRMAAEYKLQGYDCKTICDNIILELEDGMIRIYWENGAFYQEIVSNKEALEKLMRKCAEEECHN
jgi:hypothetical protein